MQAMKVVVLICVSAVIAGLFLPSCSPKQETPTHDINVNTQVAGTEETPSYDNDAATPIVNMVTPPSVDWSQINIPEVGEQGRWALTEEAAFLMGAMFSPDGETIYGYGSNMHLLLMKSADGGYSWSMLPGLQQLEEQYDVWEVLFAKMVGNHLFLCATGWGIFHSTDGGQSFELLPSIPGIEGGPWVSQSLLAWRFDAVIDEFDRPVILAGTIETDEDSHGGLWMLSYPYQDWVDMRVGNVDSGSGYNVWAVAFSPNYANDGQIIALISDTEHLWVTFKCGEEAWGESISNAQIPSIDAICDFDKALSNMAFPEDYNSQHPILFVGAGVYTEDFYRTPELVDLYRIDGQTADSGPSVVTDLDVGGEGTSTPVYSIAVNGSADTGTILAGSVGQVYRSTDGGESWEMSEKPPTGGAIMWLEFTPSSATSHKVYCTSSDPGMCMVPRGAYVAGEHALSCSMDDGITWNQISMTGTTVDEIISYAVSPDYDNDGTMFMLSRSHHLLMASFEKEQSLIVTREPDEPGVTARVFICSHQANPPMEEMIIGGEKWLGGNGATYTLDDERPFVIVEVPPLQEQAFLGPIFLENYDWAVENYPYWVEQWNDVDAQLRKAQIYVLEGSVNVNIGEVTSGEGNGYGYEICVDGEPSDWQGIEPIVADPVGDALSDDTDLKALYVANDTEFLYFMLEFGGREPNSHYQIMLDMDLDGVDDHNILVISPDEPNGPTMYLKPLSQTAPLRYVSEDIAVFGQVVEARIPLAEIDTEGFHITQVSIADWTGQEYTYTSPLDECKGVFKICIKDPVTPIIDSDSSPIPFPSIESLWKTTDGGNTWKRILTSGLELSVDNQQTKVSGLEAVFLSTTFIEDDTIFVYEEGDNPVVWISTDGGDTFSPYTGTIVPLGEQAPPTKLEKETTTSPETETTVTEPTPTPQLPLVEIDADCFMLKGEPFRFIGANIPYFGFYPEYGYSIEEAIKSASETGISVIRIYVWFGDRPWAGTLEDIDLVLDIAARHGIYVIMTLTDCCQGEWGQDLEDYFRIVPHCDLTSKSALDSFKQYIDTVVTRQNTVNGRIYRQDTTIFAWDIANEPILHHYTPQETREWLEETSDYVKQLDPNHLVTIGTVGWLGDMYESYGPRYEALNVPSIDFFSFHMYPPAGYSPPGAGESDEYLDSIKFRAHTLLSMGKPVIMEEFGYEAQNHRVVLEAARQKAGGLQRWLNIYRYQMDTAFRAGVSGAMFWGWGVPETSWVPLWWKNEDHDITEQEFCDLIREYEFPTPVNSKNNKP
jgi:photosystem II stability/assembly factor-like uncharacterized protein